MKALYRISIFLLSIFILIYIFVAFYLFQNEKKKVDLEIEKENVSTVSNVSKRTNCDTEYIVIEQNLDEKTNNTLILKIPGKFIDKTRLQLEKLILEEERAPILSEKEKGLISEKLSSFSSERVVVLKQYCKNHSENKQDYLDYSNDQEASITSANKTKEDGGFYLVAYDERVYIFKADLKEIYMVTDINIHDLPLEIEQEILDKKYIKDESELYNFLESYSS